MYLSNLNEKQKYLFLEFAYCLAVSDGNYSVEEQNLMNAYCNEMLITFDSTKIIDKLPEKIIEKINLECNEHEKKIFIFEALGLVLSDLDYTESEKQIINSALMKFGLKDEFRNECENIIREYMHLQNRLNSLIF
ncbi:hypothetical protein [Fusobacterium pseudoperiodonticum]|uniref:Co-chaperone DjlA N-terminal domain-containing protein n=1 Tax=Fusobacterium pseudoperiodonticum TaxID=2663009 RepID=A0A2G9EI69_9FUSO|nr:hypothetical protein [Fusobacterium pseudoperiodonticum]PIM80616.1 hypothetical protein CTM71_09710 [Fusobacterium pseudoperiodonticum]